MEYKSLTLKIIKLFFGCFLLPLIIAVVGFQQIYPQFTGEFTQHLGSIEVSYIQMAKFIENSWPGFSWQPLWYLGYPMSIVYTPVLPFLEFLSHNLLTWSYSHAYRMLTAVGFVGGLISVYFFARTLFKNSLSGFISALSYAILPSIIAIIYDIVAADRFGQTVIEPRRFTILVRWGEGPHILSLLFLPLAGLFLVKFLRSGNRWSLVLGAVFTSLTILTNSIGAWALFILAACVVFGETAKNYQQWRSVWLRSVIFAVISYGISAFWYNPLFITNFFEEGGNSFGMIKNLFPWGWLGILSGLAAFLFIANKLLSKIPGAPAAILFFCIMFGVVNTYYASGVDKTELVPQALRFTTEVDLGFSLIIGLILVIIQQLISLKSKLAARLTVLGLSTIYVIYLSSVQLQLAQELPKYAKPLETTGKQLSDTWEYSVAQKLKSKVGPGERAFVPGNYGFYLNYFTDVPQVRGALYQSSIHHWPDHIYYQLTNNDNPDITLAWLKITNTGWLVFNGQHEMFQDYKCPEEKFADVLSLEEEVNGDKYYKVPLTNDSLAKVVPVTIEKATMPFNAIDEEPIYNYVNLIEMKPGNLEFKEQVNGIYRITGEANSTQDILVQMAYAPGWQARDNTGKRLTVKTDPLGFILIKPVANGMQDIILTYNTPFQVWGGWVVTVITLLILITMLIVNRRSLFESKQQSSKQEKNGEE